MRSVGHVFPHAWAMDAFIQLIFGHEGLTGVLAPLGALAGFAAVLLLLATTRLRRSALAS
jgi:ABC-2 type transport system permease protein